MKQYSRLITLAGGILSLFSFALPWADEYSGVQLANTTRDGNDMGFVLWIFVASWLIIIISTAFYSSLKEMFYKFFICFSSLVGLICFVVLFFAEKLELKLDPYIENIHYGAFLSAVGFIIAIVGLMNYSKKESS